MESYSVYVHYKKNTNIPFYVGRASTVYRVASVHGRNSYWKNVAKKHGWVAKVIRSDMTRDQASRLEMRLIKLYSRAHALTNLTAGGDGCQEMSHTAETRAKMSRTRKGVPHSPEWSKKISESHKRIKGRAIIGTAPNGSEVSYTCIADASTGGFSPSNIRCVLSGNANTHKSYTWRYA